MADVRELYQAKQAAAKTKRTTFDETKHRDEVNMSNQIRSYPMTASISPERSVKESPIVEKGNLLHVSFLNDEIFLLVSSPKQFVDLNKSASAEAINNAKQRAIDILKQRLAQKQITPVQDQSLIVVNASSASPKRSHAGVAQGTSSKHLKVSNDNVEQ